MVLLKVDPRFDSLRHDSRFQDLMRRMNFPELAANRTEAGRQPIQSLPVVRTLSELR